MEEHTSCDEWAEHAAENIKLLESFAKVATKSPIVKKKTQLPTKKTTGPTKQAQLRQELTKKLNSLVGE